MTRSLALRSLTLAVLALVTVLLPTAAASAQPAGEVPSALPVPAGTSEAAAAPTLDQTAPPFPGDYSWMNGTNYQASPLLTSGPVTWTVMVDTYYGYAFNAPRDHTVFPTTTGPRHNEVNLNLGVLGVEVTGVPNVIGKLQLQTGNYVDTITGTDTSVARGAYSGLSNMRMVQQAYVGYHLPVLHGLNLMAGLFPAYVGLDSYLPQENWNYTHNLLSDFTPYYLMGAAAQLYPRQDLKAELWVFNGWQTISMPGEQPGVGWSLNWRPDDRLSLTNNLLAGRFEADQSRWRVYTDTVVQWQYARQPVPWIKSLAVAAVGDLGYNAAGTTLPATLLGGAALLHRVAFSDEWALTARGSFYTDPQKLVAPPLPGGMATPDGDLLIAEATATLDYKPTPWLLYRLEYRHDWSTIPFIAGPGGITPARAGDTAFRPDLRTSGGRLLLNATLRF